MDYNKQYGYTMIELSITLLISSIVTLALMNMFIASNQVQSITQSTLQSQESGRLAINFLKKRINLAGYNSESPLTMAFHPTCDSAEPYCTFDSNLNAGDRLAIQRTLDNEKTCAETRVRSNNNKNDIVVDLFWIKKNTLYCQTYSTASKAPIFITDISQMKKQPLADGIVAMHLLYGIRINENNQLQQSITRYISASDIKTEYPTNNRFIWQSINSIKIALLSESSVSKTTTSETKYYYLLDATPIQFNDGKSRNIFSTTVSPLRQKEY